MISRTGNYYGNRSCTITLYIMVLEDIFIPLLVIHVKLVLILPMKKKQKNFEKQLQTFWGVDKENLRKDEILQMVQIYQWLLLTLKIQKSQQIDFMVHKSTTFPTPKKRKKEKQKRKD